MTQYKNPPPGRESEQFKYQLLVRLAKGDETAFAEALHFARACWLRAIRSYFPEETAETLVSWLPATLLDFVHAYLQTGALELKDEKIVGINVAPIDFMANMRRRKAYQYKHSKTAVDNVRALQENQPNALDKLYSTYREQYRVRANANFPRVSALDKEDVFQDAWIIIIENYIRTGRIGVIGEVLEGLSIPLFNFFYTICWRLLAKKAARVTMESLPHHLPEKTAAPLPDDDGYPDTPPVSIPMKVPAVDKGIIGMDNLNALEIAFAKLDKPCQRLIFYRYYLNLANALIVIIMGGEVKRGQLRTRLYRCIIKLKKYYFGK